jgi:hypothetical protein
MRRSSASAPDLSRLETSSARSPFSIQLAEETDTKPSESPVQPDGGNENVAVSVPSRKVVKSDMYKGGAVEVR